jgi:hypothetical protein
MLAVSCSGAACGATRAQAHERRPRPPAGRIGHGSATRRSSSARSPTRPGSRTNPRRPGNNQRLEFLGDSVLQLVLTEALFALYPGDREGELTKRRAVLGKGAFLAQLAARSGSTPACAWAPARRPPAAAGATRPSRTRSRPWWGRLPGRRACRGRARRVVLGIYGDLGRASPRSRASANPKGRLQEIVQPVHGNQAIRYEVLAPRAPTTSASTRSPSTSLSAGSARAAAPPRNSRRRRRRGPRSRPWDPGPPEMTGAVPAQDRRRLPGGARRRHRRGDAGPPVARLGGRGPGPQGRGAAGRGRRVLLRGSGTAAPRDPRLPRVDPRQPGHARGVRRVGRPADGPVPAARGAARRAAPGRSSPSSRRRPSLLQPVPAIEKYAASEIVLARGSRQPFQGSSRGCAASTTTARRSARRRATTPSAGGIIDVYPVTAPSPTGSTSSATRSRTSARSTR